MGLLQQLIESQIGSYFVKARRKLTQNRVAVRTPIIIEVRRLRRVAFSRHEVL